MNPIFEKLFHLKVQILNLVSVVHYYLYKTLTKKVSSSKQFIQVFFYLGSLSRFQYLKMVFDWNKWRQDSLSLMSSTISGIYGTLLVCIYIAFAFTELVKFPDLQLYLEKNGFFTYLFALRWHS